MKILRKQQMKINMKMPEREQVCKLQVFGEKRKVGGLRDEAHKMQTGNFKIHGRMNSYLFLMA